MNKKISLDIVMLSTFDKNAGGRETWLYNFLPLLLKDDDFKRINLFGFKTPEDLDHKNALLSLDESPGKKKLSPIILEKKANRWPKAFSMFKALKEQSIPFSPDFVMPMGVFEMVMVNRLSRYKRTKKIVWLRSIFIQEKAYTIPKYLRKMFLKWEIKHLKKANILICNGDDIRDFYKKYGLDLQVIKNGVDLKKWALPPPKLVEPIKVAYVGRLSQVKGIEDYFKLAQNIKNFEHKNKFEFHVVGQSGAYNSQVEYLVNNKIIIYHNVISNDKLPEFLNTIDVCVALTYSSAEGGGGGTSNAMLEQMAAGRIMLAWDNVIFRQYLSADNAYLAKQFSVEELTVNLIQIQKNNIEAKLKCQKGKRVVEPYTFNSNYNKFKSLLTENRF